jgi:xanthine/CO dehydrogenase XdhC/CoxF family maturation factor
MAADHGARLLAYGISDELAGTVGLMVRRRSRRFSSAAHVRVGWPQEVMRDIELGPRDAVLVFTHDPKFDEPALLAALRTDAGYIGALRSRQTTGPIHARHHVRGEPP